MERRIFRSAGLVSAALMVSRVTGVAREMIMARLFGAGQAYDAFLLGSRIPNLARDLLAEGALSSAFIPVFTRCLATQGKREAGELAQVAGTALLAVSGAVCALGIVFTPQLVWLLAPGFAQVPGKFELAVRLTRIMFPFLALVALAAQAMGLLNACNRFGIPALASAVFNVTSVSLGLILALHIDPLTAMSIGVVLGGLAQFLWQAPGLWRAGFRFRPRVNWRHPGLRAILRLMGPAVVGGAAVQINVMVNTHFASAITDASGQVINGPVSWLGYAFRFMQLPIGIFGVAIAAATLPELARSAAARSPEEFGGTLARSVGMTILLTVPSSVGLAVLGESMIAAIYQSGRFTAADTHQTALALAGYSAGLAGYALIKLLAPALYALDDARSPMLISVASIVVNLAAATLMVKAAGLGHVGLALSTSVNALFGTGALFTVLRGRLRVAGRGLAASAAKITAASAIMGLACMATSRIVLSTLGHTRTGSLVDVAVSIPAGALVFFAAARALRVRELHAAWTVAMAWRAKLLYRNAS